MTRWKSDSIKKQGCVSTLSGKCRFNVFLLSSLKESVNRDDTSLFSFLICIVYRAQAKRVLIWITTAWNNNNVPTQNQNALVHAGISL